MKHMNKAEYHLCVNAEAYYNEQNLLLVKKNIIGLIILKRSCY